MDIKSLTVEQLKSMAYDQLVMLEKTQNNINILNNEIANREKQLQPTNQPVVDKKEETPA